MLPQQPQQQRNNASGVMLGLAHRQLAYGGRHGRLAADRAMLTETFAQVCEGCPQLIGQYFIFKVVEVAAPGPGQTGFH